MGELALDSFIKCFFDEIELLYSRVKYLEKIPQSKEVPDRKGHEVKGYDGLVFSKENGQKYMFFNIFWCFYEQKLAYIEFYT